MDAAEARSLFAGARSARLATVSAEGLPHVVPICFALADDCLYTAIDFKPKRGVPLRRLANIAANPHVSVLADEYQDADWLRLWWARADGLARIVTPADDRHAVAIGLLGQRYRQYAEQPPGGAVIVVDVARWSGWRASDAGQR